jgi:hypothetical protein
MSLMWLHSPKDLHIQLRTWVSLLSQEAALGCKSLRLTMYYSTDAGVFTPDPPGDKSNNYNFLANCTTDKYGTWQVYGTFKLEDYVD